MPKSANQKAKLLVLMKIFQEKTDESHALTVQELIRELEMSGIPAERKSIYDDIETLRNFGLDIVVSHSKTTGYYQAARTFELPELRLLVDSVQSSKFITHKKSAELIKKIESLCSVYDAQTLQRQVFVTNRIKTMNESIYYNVDAIQNGIGEGKKISFKYFEYTILKEKAFRRGGARYLISPWALTWDDENYYMVGYDGDSGLIKHYRVDKMADILVTKEPRDGQDHFRNLDLALYSKKLFSMFNGEEANVRLEFANRLIGVVIDRFGKDIIIAPTDGEHFAFQTRVAVSPQFFAWIASFGSEAKILSPQSVVAELQKLLREVSAQYADPAE